MIFVFFKPLDIKEEKFTEVPLFEIKNFMLYELNREGLQTFMSGESALKYEDRYLVKKIDFRDNSENFKSSMIANQGLYKENIVYLDGNVSYKNENGFSFFSQHVIYDKIKSLVTSHEKYIAYMGKDKMIGSTIEYNTLLKQVNAKNIEVHYKIKER